jgi:hypothetical protein
MGPAKAKVSAWLAGVALGATGCSEVLGLDAPSLREACTLDGCFDGSVTSEPRGEGAGGANDGAAGPAANDAGGGSNANSPDASVDGAPAPAPSPPEAGIADVRTDAPRTLPCGATTGSTVYCAPSTETCCAVNTSTGSSYSCIPISQTCPGFAIRCASPYDCAENEVCCRGDTAQACTTTICSPGQFVCDPGQGECSYTYGSSYYCDPLASGSPYYICGP